MAKRLTVNDKKWEKVNPKNKEMMEDFLLAKGSLSPQSLKQYNNALKIFFIWVLEFAKNKFIVDLKKRDFLKYQNFLLNKGLSSNAVRFKRSAVSSLCNYIENYYEDKYPTFRNITSNVENIPNDNVYEKEPLTLEELDKLRKHLKENEKWQQLAYLEISYSTGARREEIRQLRKEIINYKINDKGYYTTHKVRCKGKGRKGEIRELAFSQQAMDALRKWIEVRGEDNCEYIFVSKYKGKIKQVSESTFNYWCRNIFSKVVGRRVHPHLLRCSRATNLTVNENKDISAAKQLLGHKSSETTEIYVVRDESEVLADCFN